MYTLCSNSPECLMRKNHLFNGREKLLSMLISWLAILKKSSCPLKKFILLAHVNIAQIFTILEKQMTEIYTAERLSCRSVFWSFLQNQNKLGSKKAILYNKSLINLICSGCTGKNCLQFLFHRPHSFITQSVQKISGNIFLYRPHTWLISP